ncbi:hypothetical protein [Natrinema halophilum]|uniref:Uncharacterized protein n=1 Tax=Natrinema halophilum TaxID=1699371 RepID=A0A7D5GIH2_9EURY|nr:hypothetical protein [Natrinema halophilum]QLG49788.1 hypothetical protein HYG82_13420 [Natrinema halophilum]
MTTRDRDGDRDRMRVRLEEVLAEVETLDGHLRGPLTLEPAISNIEMIIAAYETFETDSGERPVVVDN